MVQETIKFVKETLNPSGDDYGIYGMQYRYEHTLRVAAIGKRIAIEEKLPVEALIIGCLLHDIGYSQCETAEECNKHAEFGEKVARAYLEKLNLPKELKESIGRGILIHDGDFSQIDGAPTTFELCIRDADDIDRFDALRMGMSAKLVIGEHPVCDIINNCINRIKSLEPMLQHECATKTANRLWQANITYQLDYFKRLLEQMESTHQTLI